MSVQRCMDGCLSAPMCTCIDGWVRGRAGTHARTCRCVGLEACITRGNGCTRGLVFGRRERTTEEPRSDPCGENLVSAEKVCSPALPSCGSPPNKAHPTLSISLPCARPGFTTPSQPMVRYFEELPNKGTPCAGADHPILPDKDHW